jgi:hypothetical protein
MILGKKNATDTAANTSQKPAAKTEESLKITVVDPGKVILEGGYADPTIVPTANGYRMYVNRQSGGPSGYGTFTSSDGISFVKEKDNVIAGAATGRAVVLPNGIRFYYPGAQPIKPADPPADLFSSFSIDGVTFAKDPGALLKPRSNSHYLEGPTVFQLSDKSWRMYFNENTIASGNQLDGEIWGASSTDGLAWTRDEKATLQYDSTEKNALNNIGTVWPQVLHPFVLKNPNGGYIMFYNSHSEIFAATSNDGKTWKKIGKIGIHGADLDGFFQKDGSLRVYYGDFNPQSGGLVYTAVLKIK